MSPSAAGAELVVASAPGRLRLSGAPGGPSLGVALDRRATCRVETGVSGIEIESKDSLTKTSAREVGELVERSPTSLVAQALGVLGVRDGLRVVTEWKLPAGSGIDGGAALALATTAAVSLATGQRRDGAELVGLAGEAAARARHTDGHGLHAALWGGVVLARGGGASLEAERVGVDPGRIEESLMLVDAGDPRAPEAPPLPPPAGTHAAALTGRIVEALARGRYEDVVGLVAEESGLAPAGASWQRVAELVREAGGAAWAPGEGRLVAIWAPPGARGAGRREAVQAALKAGGLRLLPIRLDLRGLALE